MISLISYVFICCPEYIGITLLACAFLLPRQRVSNASERTNERTNSTQSTRPRQQAKTAPTETEHTTHTRAHRRPSSSLLWGAAVDDDGKSKRRISSYLLLPVVSSVYFRVVISQKDFSVISNQMFKNSCTHFRTQNIFPHGLGTRVCTHKCVVCREVVSGVTQRTDTLLRYCFPSHYNNQHLSSLAHHGRAPGQW